MDFQDTFCCVQHGKCGKNRLTNKYALLRHAWWTSLYMQLLLSSSYQASFILITLPYNSQTGCTNVYSKDFSKVIFNEMQNNSFWNTLLNICSMNYGLKNNLANTYSWSVMYIINVWDSLNSLSFKYRNLKCTDKRIDLYIHTEAMKGHVEYIGFWASFGERPGQGH